MISRPWVMIVSVVLLILMPAACGQARAQFGLFGNSGGYASSSPVVTGYGANPYAGYASFGGSYSSGYGVRTGQIGSGYQSAGRLYQQGYQAARPQTTIAFQPLYSAITSVPGWYGPTATLSARRRLHSRPSVPRTPPFDDNGKILWPSTIPDDPAAPGCARPPKRPFAAVVQESKSTGHASVRPVIDAKNKLSAFERKVMPVVKTKNVTDGDALDRFFFDLDKALDAMTYVY